MHSVTALYGRYYSRLKEIKKLIDKGEYFTINRARQYGKTTTLNALADYLKDEYDVLSLDFQNISDGSFGSEELFVQVFSMLVLRKRRFVGIPEEICDKLQEIVARKENKALLIELFSVLLDWCAVSAKTIVLFIDEVDSTTNNQVFLDFLAQLRGAYIEQRTHPEEVTFWSVVLAGVTDVKHLKSKIRPEQLHKVNSPWNIAADFLSDMSLPEDGIRKMLEEYDADHHTGMDTAEMARQLRAYTNGYPFLVSRLCQLMDTQVSRQMESLAEAWTKKGFVEALKLILSESNTLFESLAGKLDNYPELRKSLRSILIKEEKLVYNAQQTAIAQLQMYGFVRKDHNMVKIDNRIFETLLYNLFLSDDELKSNVFVSESNLARSQFVKDGRLDMRLVLERFIATYTQVFGPLVDKFKEKDGRELFLLYLKPIINGTGNYYIEAQTRDQTRTDVVVDYLGQQYVIELKIWRGERYHAAGEQQISDYLEYFGLDTGYMLSFNFNQKKETGVKQVQIGEKVLFEATL